MISPFTALAIRTLRLDARSFATYALRFTLCGAVLLMLLAASSNWAYVSAPGAMMLAQLVYCGSLLVTLAAITQFSSVITEEKEEQTIGLLRMAGLRPLAIILAKAGARMWDILLVSAAIMPFTFLCITLGGVSTTQVLASFVAIASYVILLGSLGLLISVIRPTTQSAAAWMVLALILQQAIPLLFLRFPWFATIEKASIWVALSDILATGYAGGIVTSQVWSSLAIGGALFLASLALFDRCVKDEEDLGPVRTDARRGGWVRSWFRFRRTGSGIAALVAKDVHFCCGGRFMMLVKPLALLVIEGLFLLLLHILGNQDSLRATMVGDQLMAIAAMWLPLEFAIHLARLFSQEIREQTLSSLCLMPYAARSIVTAKVLAGLVALVPVLLILVAGIILSPADFTTGCSNLFGELGSWMMVSSYILFLCLTVLFSMILRRGALLVALGMVLGGLFLYGMVASIAFDLGSRESYLGIAILIMLVISAIIAANIPRRLARCASR
jgi:hypothetical protein